MADARHPSTRRRTLLLAGLGAPLLLQTRGLLGAPACAGAETNLMGPAYRAGAPLRTTLCDPAERGTPLRMNGIVRAAGTCEPLADAQLQVWQVGASGEYDMDSDRFDFRGTLRPDADGRYHFDSVVPAAYGRRAKHIHYLASCPGYEPHITQSYFEGDERLKTDGLVKAPLVVSLQKVGKRMHGTFDLALRREQPAADSAKAAWPEYSGVYELAPGVTLTITHDEERLRWKLDPVEQPGDPVSGVLYPRSETGYYCAEYDLTNEFVRDEAGRVTHFTTSDGGIGRKVKAI